MPPSEEVGVFASICRELATKAAITLRAELGFGALIFCFASFLFTFRLENLPS